MSARRTCPRATDTKHDAPVFNTFRKELKEGGLEALAPVSRMAPADGVAMTDEVLAVVSQRRGQVRPFSTKVKSAAPSLILWSNNPASPDPLGLNDPKVGFLQELAEAVAAGVSQPAQSIDVPRRSACSADPCLARRVDGAPNYRKADAAVTASRDGALSARKVYGTGMPSSEGLRQALDKMGAGKDGKEVVYWTSLREYVIALLSIDWVKRGLRLTFGWPYVRPGSLSSTSLVGRMSSGLRTGLWST
jgi:hypothetical protein